MVFEHDVLGEGVVYVRPDISNQGHHLDCDPLAVHAPGKRQDAADHRGATFGAGLDRRQRPEPRRVVLVLLKQPDGQENRREHVVEIVGDAAGQRADALHPLGAQVLLLQLLPVGDVLERTLHQRDRAVGPAFGFTAHAHPLSRALVRENLHLQVEWRAVPRACVNSADNLVPPRLEIERQCLGE